jgi:hypothetical protein
VIRSHTSLRSTTPRWIATPGEAENQGAEGNGLLDSGNFIPICQGFEPVRERQEGGETLVFVAKYFFRNIRFESGTQLAVLLGELLGRGSCGYSTRLLLQRYF